MCNIHITRFIFHLPTHWSSQIAMAFSFLDVRDFFFCLVRMQTCFLSFYPLAIWEEGGMGDKHGGTVHIFLKGFLEQVVKKTDQFHKTHPSKGKGLWYTGRSAYDFMPYGVPHAEEQAGGISRALLYSKVNCCSWIWLFFSFFPVVRGSLSK